MSKQESEWVPTDEDIERYELLDGMLRSLKKEFDILSKKKANDPLNKIKIKMVNKVLEPLEQLLMHEPSSTFLEKLTEEDVPTNSDVVLIISQYKTALSEFESSYRSGYKWNTVENRMESELEEDVEYDEEYDDYDEEDEVLAS